MFQFLVITFLAIIVLLLSNIHAYIRDWSKKSLPESKEKEKENAIQNVDAIPIDN